jgi:hypothetical protein
MHRDKPGLGQHLGPGADPPQVAAVADADQCESVRTRPSDRQRHRFRADHLAVAEAAIDDHQGPGVDRHRGVAVGRQFAGSDPGEILGRADRTVAVVAGQTRLDQMRGNRLCLRGLRPAGAEQPRQGVVQRGGGDPHQAGPPWASRAANSIASIMLDGLAMPLPAMSKAVP